MNFKSLSNKVRPSVETEATAKEQDFIMEELSDEAQAAVCGGKKRTTTTTSEPAPLWEVEATGSSLFMG